MFAQPSVAAALALAFSLPVSLNARAQSDASNPSSVVVTGARMPEAASQSVRPVQVLTADDIAASGVRSLPDLLATLGGVESLSSGGLGQLSSVFIRGANSNHTVVLVDGVRIGSATSGAAAMESLPLALIDRVEVLAGASSSLYGADAVGGVIQVFTKRADNKPFAAVALTVGETDLGQLSAAYAARHGDTELTLGANVLRTAGINATTTDNTYSYNPDRDGYWNRSAQARVAQRLGGGHQVDLQWLRSDGKVHFDDSPSIDSYAINRTQTLSAHWAGPWGPAVQSEFRLARAWDKADSVSAYPSNLSTTQDQASWLNHVALGAGQLNLGLEWLNQQVDSAGTAYSVTSRSIAGALLGWHARYGALAVQADARYDDNSQFGGHPTGQLAAAWQMDASTKLRASVGTAFKAPTFNDLYAPAAWGSNPALQPERSTGLELGADWRHSDTTVGLTWFDNRVRNLIAYDANFVLANISRADTKGLTLNATTALDSATQLRMSLSAQDPRNVDTGAQLLRRARVFGDLNLSRQMGALRLGGALHLAGRRDDMNWNTYAVEHLGGYGLLALYGSWQFRPEWALEARVNNLADKAYVQAIGYTTPGRQAQMTLRWTPAL